VKTETLHCPADYAASYFYQYLKGGYKPEYPNLFLGYHIKYVHFEDAWNIQRQNYIFDLYMREPGFLENGIFDIGENVDSYRFNDKDFSSIDEIIHQLTKVLKNRIENSSLLDEEQKIVSKIRGDLIYRMLTAAGFFLVGEYTISKEDKFNSRLTLDKIACPIHIRKYPIMTNLIDYESI
jgi:hypothetical protein